MATRGGIKCVRPRPDGDIDVDMGQPRFLADRPVVTAAPHLSGQPSRPARAVVQMPNPHVVVDVDDTAALAALDLTRAPDVAPALPTGQNVEFVVRLGERHLRMRVHERGSGETRSCGTGICAAAIAFASDPDGTPWRVDVPGGTCTVTWTPDGVVLSGPAVIVAEIELDQDWWQGLAVP